MTRRVAEANNLLPQLIYIDEPRHTALRALVTRVFSPRRIAGMEEEIRTCIRRLIDSIAPQDVCEFQHEYTSVIPSVVIGGMIGLDEQYIAPMRECTEAFISGSPVGEPGAAAREIYAMFAELLEERRRRPRDDMISAEIDGERLSEQELLGFCLLLVLAGNDTTASLIGSGMVLLQNRPQQRDMLLNDSSLWDDAIKEINRIESPTRPCHEIRPVMSICTAPIFPPIAGNVGVGHSKPRRT